MPRFGAPARRRPPARGAGGVAVRGRLVLLLGAASAAGDAEAPSCWSAGYEFDRCCRTVLEPPRFASVTGDPACWAGDFTYDACCVPEKAARVVEAQRAIEHGRYREASDAMARLVILFAGAPGSDVDKLAFRTWEKAAFKFKDGLLALPDALSYVDVLFGGLGVDCAADPEGGALLHADWLRCCWRAAPDTEACDQIFGMMQVAVARTSPDLEAYFSDFAEQWAFRHFTPSVLGTSDHSQDEFDKLAGRARTSDAAIFGALASTPEPKLGIPWSESFVDFSSDKFKTGLYMLTTALSHVRRCQPGRPLHVIEMGAGYGNLPRTLIAAREALAAVDPPVALAGYTIFDVLSVSMLQRWYLSKTLGGRADLREWLGGDRGELWRRARDDAGLRLGALPLDAPLPVHLVDTSHRDAFAHAFQRAELSRADEASRPLRLVLAVNSWHEMGINEFAWYYNEFFGGPASRLLADYVLYVANVEWARHAEKEEMIDAIAGRRFETIYEHRYPNRVRLFRRRAGVE